MQLNIRLVIVVVVQDVAVLCEKNIKRLRINDGQMGHKSLVRNNAALTPPAIRDLGSCRQLRRSSFKTW
jgi:hypothetical protein